MVKDHTFALFNFGTLPLVQEYLPKYFINNFKYLKISYISNKICWSTIFKDICLLLTGSTHLHFASCYQDFLNNFTTFLSLNIQRLTYRKHTHIISYHLIPFKFTNNFFKNFIVQDIGTQLHAIGTQGHIRFDWYPGCMLQ